VALRFNRGGGLHGVGTILVAALTADGASESFLEKFSACCASAVPPLVSEPTASDAARSDASVDFRYMIDFGEDAKAHVEIFEYRSEEPHWRGDARGLERLVDAGFGQC
jgi:hypothetical protein